MDDQIPNIEQSLVVGDGADVSDITQIGIQHVHHHYSGDHDDLSTDLAEWWSAWSGATTPPLSASLVLAGREEAIVKARAALEGPPSVIAVKSDSRDEAIAFLAAILLDQPEAEGHTLGSSPIVVRSAEAFARCVENEQPSVLIVDFDDRERVAIATQKGHHVIVPLGQAEPANGTIVEIPKIRYQPAREALEAMGISHEHSGEDAALARRSLTAFRRNKAAAPIIRRPEWASPQAAIPLLPALFVGTWLDTSAGDRNVIEQIACSQYELVAQTLVRWENTPDAPFHRIGSIWIVASKEDAWRQIAPLLTADMIGRFVEIAITVLSEDDPKYDLPVSDQWFANLRGKTLTCSNHIRKGIADTLALAASLDTATNITGGGQNLANRIVRSIMATRPEGMRGWASMGSVLPLLAEAAPEEFLTAIEQSIQIDQDHMRDLLSDNQVGPFGGTPHVGLLWALEGLAWSSRFLSRAARALAALSLIDPNPQSNNANRPFRSLQNIFVPWHPQTSAALEQRERIIDMLRRQNPTVARSLLLSMVPGQHAFVIPSHTPQWRDWGPDGDARVTSTEHTRAVAWAVTRLLEDVDGNGQRLAELIPILKLVPLEQREAILIKLEEIASDLADSQGKVALADQLRATVSKHRDFSDAQWALPSDVVDRLAAAYERVQPANPIERHASLFAIQPSLLTTSRRDYSHWASDLQNARNSAIGVVFASGGVEAVENLAGRAERPFDVGIALGRTDLADGREEDFLKRRMGAKDEFARGFVLARASRSTEWIVNQLTNLNDKLTDEQLADFYTCLPLVQLIWDMVEAGPSQARHLYWRSIRPFVVEDNTQLEYVVSKLLQHGNPHAAIPLIHHYIGNEAMILPSESIASVLEALYQTPPPQGFDLGSIAYEIGDLLDVLESSQTVSQDRLVHIEFAFLNLLHFVRTPKLLARQIANNPAFFVEALSIVFRRRGAPVEALSEEEKLKATLVHQMLDSCRMMPGMTANSAVNPQELNEWVNEVRVLATEAGRIEIADQYIGHLLSSSPQGNDGAWPAEPVRDLIETINSRDLENGLEIQVINSRGVTSRGTYDGGSQERDLANRYKSYADIVQDMWPSTGAMLNRLADNYMNHATMEDLSAGLSEDLGH